MEGNYLAACLWTPASRRRALLSELDLCKWLGQVIVLRACHFGPWSSRFHGVRLRHHLSGCKMMICFAGWNVGHNWDLLGPIWIHVSSWESLLHATSRVILCNSHETCGTTAAGCWPTAWEDRQGQILGAVDEHFKLFPHYCSKNVTATPDIKWLTSYQMKMHVMIQDSIAFSVL